MPAVATASLMRALADDRVQLVLEVPCLDRAMHAALLGSVRLPPPAACANRLARSDRLRAGRAARRPRGDSLGAGPAADGRVALLVERVARHVVLADVVPDLVLLPLRER